MPKLLIDRDPDPMNPREWDNLGTFQIYHRRYASPDKIVREPPYTKRDEISLKVWGYDHGSVHYATGETNPFHCPWDSGFAGIIFAPKERIYRYFGVKRITKTVRQRVIDALKAEVEEWNRYINGDIHMWMILDNDGEVMDSCGGYHSEEEAEREGNAFLAELIASKDQSYA